MKEYIDPKLEDLSSLYNWTERELQRIEDYAKSESINFLRWNMNKTLGYVEYIKTIKPIVKSEEIEHNMNDFESATIDERYMLYQQSKIMNIASEC